MVICPPFTDLRTLQTLIEADKLEIELGAQNCHWEDQGAFTGEVSPPMLAKLNVQLRDRRALGAPPALRRDRRDGEPEAQGGASSTA